MSIKKKLLCTKVYIKSPGSHPCFSQSGG